MVIRLDGVSDLLSKLQKQGFDFSITKGESK
jgi:hypothetical protein